MEAEIGSGHMARAGWRFCSTTMRGEPAQMTMITDPVQTATLPDGEGPDGQLRPTRRGRLVATAAATVVGMGIFAFGYSLGGYFANSEGEPATVIAATWARDHGLGGVVAVAEDFYYGNIDTVEAGGAPEISAELEGQSAANAVPDGSASAPPHLNPPANMTSPAAETVAGEGVWQPVASSVDGVPAVYATRIRPDDVYTSQFASLMWFDPKLADFTMIPGYQEPGGESPTEGALPQNEWSRVLANFNGAFRLQDTGGGYYYNGTEVAPLQEGIASTVIYKDGSIKVGEWGRDFTMTPEVAVVRQNLHLLLDGGVSKASDGFSWGATTHGENLAWRSAIGQREDGSVVYVGSPGLSAESMADTLVRAGVARAMVLDMNDWWVAGFYFTHDANGAPVCHKLDPNIQEGCDRFLKSYKRDSFQVLAKPGMAVGGEQPKP
ncbi:MAG TPA: phosphodiester glycosidase family protein [Actinomycetota bacterium]|nr:phosphodiester glycosidase family protein [Actinomycetota bacterium]